MHSKVLLSALGGLALMMSPVIGAGPAAVQSNPQAVSYQAVLPPSSFNKAIRTNITGSVIATSVAGGSGVTIKVNYASLPDVATYGPFIYHIHEKPVPSNGNCTGTGAHLDPTARGESPPCDPSAPQTCQAGDLSGKHGNITTTSYSASYSDLYLSTVDGSPYYFGDKSVVIHMKNTTRLACANFTEVATVTTNATTTGVKTSATPTVSPFKGAAAAVGGAGVVGGVVAVVVAALL